MSAIGWSVVVGFSCSPSALGAGWFRRVVRLELERESLGTDSNSSELISSAVLHLFFSSFFWVHLESCSDRRDSVGGRRPFWRLSKHAAASHLGAANLSCQFRRGSVH